MKLKLYQLLSYDMQKKNITLYNWVRISKYISLVLNVFDGDFRIKYRFS